MSMAEMMFSHTHLYSGTEGLGIGHVNFHLRGEESDADEALVREWAEKRGLPFHKADFDTAAYAAEKGISIEMAARELRYGWFATVCREHGYDAVAVAHNANDNAETLLLNLLRGTGVRGICGMEEKSLNGGLKIVRPILGMTREEIEEYAAEHSVPYRTDRTNLETDCKRNKLRNLVFPVFRDINPSFVRTFGKNMGHFAQARDILDEWFEEKLSRFGGDRIPLGQLLSERHWEYILFRLLENRGFPTSAATDISRLIRSRGESGVTFAGKTFNGPACRVMTTADSLVFTGNEAPDKPLHLIETFPRPDGIDLKCPKGILLLDAGKVPSGACVREWRKGDWMCPLGMNGRRKKLSDIFSDAKMDLAAKEAATVLADGDHVLAILCTRIDEAVKVTPDTKRLLKITEQR